MPITALDKFDKVQVDEPLTHDGTLYLVSDRKLCEYALFIDFFFFFFFFGCLGCLANELTVTFLTLQVSPTGRQTVHLSDIYPFHPAGPL